MASSYIGDPTATQAPSAAPGQDVDPTVRLPSDGDALNAASVAQAFKALADFSAWLTNNGLFKAAARTVTGVLTFAQKIVLNGVAGDTNPAIETTATPTVRKLLWKIPIGGSAYARIYSVDTGRAYELTLNAAYNTGTSQWDIDAAGGAIYPVKFQVRATSAGNFLFFRHDGVVSFADGAWDHQAIVNVLTAGLALTGAFTATTSITAGTTITATANDITASAGKISATVNDIEAGKHFVGMGSAPTIAANANLGAGASANIDGNSSDSSHQVSLTSGAGTANGDLAEITLAASFSGRGRAVIMATGSDETALTGVYAKRTAANKYVIGCKGGVADGKTYVWSAIVIGAP